MLKSKFLANSLILSVLVLGVACSSDNDSSNSSAQDSKKKEQEDKLNKEISAVKSLAGENKPIAAAKLDITSALTSDDAGTVSSSIIDGKSLRCSIIKVKDTDNQYAAQITYSGNRTSTRFDEKLTVIIPLLGLTSNVATPSVPSQVNYTLIDTDPILFNKKVTELKQVDSSSSASISVLRTHNSYLALIGSLNIKAINDKGESVILKGDIRCSSMVMPNSSLLRDLNENEALKSIDVREEISALQKVNEEKLAALEAAKPGFLDKVKARIAETNEAMRKEDEAMQNARLEMFARSSEVAGKTKEAIVNAGNAVTNTVSAGYNKAIDQSSLAMEIGADIASSNYNKAVAAASQGVEDVMNGKARDAMILGATDLIENTVNMEKAKAQVYVNAYNTAVNQTSEAIEAGVELTTQAKDAYVAQVTRNIETSKAVAQKSKNAVVSAYDAAAESISLMWSGALKNKASFTYKELGNNLTRNISITQDPSEPGYLSCRVSEESGEKRLIIRMHDIKYPANSFIASLSFPIDENFVPVNGGTINIENLKNDGSKEVKSPALLTPQLGAKIVDGDLIKTRDGQTHQTITYAIFADYKDEKGLQVLLDGNVKCVFKK